MPHKEPNNPKYPYDEPLFKNFANRNQNAQLLKDIRKTGYASEKLDIEPNPTKFKSRFSGIGALADIGTTAKAIKGEVNEAGGWKNWIKGKPRKPEDL